MILKKLQIETTWMNIMKTAKFIIKKAVLTFDKRLPS